MLFLLSKYKRLIDVSFLTDVYEALVQNPAVIAATVTVEDPLAPAVMTVRTMEAIYKLFQLTFIPLTPF